jgi:hypothetical protein
VTTANDGYGSPIARDARGVSGGTPGNVNTASYTHTITGADEVAFEWNALFLLDNYAKAGENVALYAQANKHSSGPTWGACIETCDTTPGDSTGLVGAEVDCWVSGPDNGLRFGVDVVVGDAGTIREKKPQGTAEGSVGVRVGTCQATPWATWGVGYQATHFRYAGLHLASNATRAIHLEGNYVVGLDLSTAKTQSAIRLAPGQRMTFEPTDTISWSWRDGRLRVQNGAVSVLEIDTTTGDIYKMGKKVL